MLADLSGQLDIVVARQHPNDFRLGHGSPLPDQGKG